MSNEQVSRNTPDRMDLPFVGLVTFARKPACENWDKLDGADACERRSKTPSVGSSLR